MFGVYVTHPQVLIDPAVPVPDWGLSPLGRGRAALVSAAAERARITGRGRLYLARVPM